MGETTAGSIQLNIEVTSDLNKSIQAQARKVAEHLKKQVEESGSGIFDGLQDGMDTSLDKMTESIKKALNPIKMQMQAFVQQMEAIVRRLGNVQMPTPQASDIDMPQAQGRASNTPRAPPISSIRTPKIDSTSFDTSKIDAINLRVNTLTQSIEASKNKLEMYKQELETLNDAKSGIESINSEIIENKNRISELNIQVDVFKAKLQGVTSLKEKIAINEELKSLDQQIGISNADIEYLKLKLLGLQKLNPSESIIKLNEKIAKLSATIKKSNSSLQGYERYQKKAEKGTKGFRNAIKGADSSLKKFWKDINKIKTSGFVKSLKVAKSALQKLGNGFKSAGGPVTSFGKHILGLNSSTKKANKNMGRTSMSASRLAKSFLIYRIGFAALSKGVNALTKSLGETLMTNSQFASSLNQIKSNLATAFTPVIQAILPALNALMGTLATVTAYISAFTSAIFGKTLASSQQATQGIIDAKDAMGAYGSSTEKAAKKAKELQRSLLGFDEINKLNEKPDTSDDGSGSKKPVYTPTPIDPSGVSDFVKKMKEMFVKGDWGGIGKVIGQSINKGVTKFTKWISWSNVGAEVTNFMNAFTGIFNSSVATIDWNAIGNMLGEGINTMVNTAFLFFTGINWQNLGTSIANGLNGMVHTINWSKLGQTLGAQMQASINVMYGFVTTADWAGIGKGLGDGLMGLINYVDWKKFAATLAKGISGAISSVHNFIKAIDWGGVGRKIAGSINSFFTNMNWADMGATLSDGAKGLLDTLIVALANIDWYKVGDSIADFLCSIDWIGVIGRLGVALVLAIGGITQAIAEAFVKIAKAMWDGFCKGVQEFFSDPGAFIKKHIVDPFVKWVKSLFGIHSPSTVMAEMGGYVMQGLINGIKSIPIVGSIASAVGDGLNWIKGKYNDFKVKGKELFDNVKNGIAHNPITKTVGSAIGKGVDAVKNTYDTFKTKGSEIIDKLKGGINLKSDTVSRAVSGIASNISSVFGNLDVGSWGSDMMSGLASGISGAAGWVSNAVSGIADTISSWLHFSRPDVGPLHYYEEWMPDMVRGLSQTLENSTPMFIDKVKSLAGSMTNVMQSSLNTPTIAFAGETELSVTHEWKESNKSKDLTMKDVIEEIKSLKQKFDEVKEEIRNKDMNAYIDGDDVTKKVVDNVNSDTRKNGKCPIDM